MIEEDDQRGDLAGCLFALLTARLEDGSELAVRGQGAPSAERRELASQLIEISQEVEAVSEALLLLFAPASD